MSNSPCAACKCLRRKCTLDCPFAPYFPPDNPQKFTNVHKVFGASNVAKLLNEISTNHREDAVNSLAYEAECRLRDPVLGCFGLISVLQHKLKQVQHDVEAAKKELATYVGPAAMVPMLGHAGGIVHQQVQLQPPNFGLPGYQVMPYNTQPMNSLPMDVTQQQQFLEGQQFAAQEQEMLRAYQLQQQQQQFDLMKFGNVPGPAVTVAGYNHQMLGDMQLQPYLALGSSYETLTYQEPSDPHDQLLIQPQAVSATHHSNIPQQQLVLHGSHSQPHLMRAKSEEGDTEHEDDGEDKNIGP